MNIIRKFAASGLTAMTVFAAVGCTEPDDNGNGDATLKTTFTTVTEAVYRGDNGDGKGLYRLTLETEGQTLHLEFLSTLTDAADPVPDEGTYSYSAYGELHTFNGNGYWMSSVDGTEITRKLASGSFSFEASDAGYKIAGTAGGRDGAKLGFAYEGEIKFVDFNGTPAADAITCLTANCIYYGKYYIPNAANYYLVLFDTIHTSEGQPYNYRICLDFTSKFPSGGSLMPALGTYRPDKDGVFAEGTFLEGLMNGANGTLWQIPSSDGSTRYMVSDGFFTIREAEGGKYQIFGTLKDNYDRELSFNYVGTLPCQNDAVGTFSSLSDDFAMGEAFYANQKCSEESPEGDLWTVWFYDEASWTTKGKDGYFIRFDIALEHGKTRIPAGEYTASAHVLMPEFGNYIPGYIFAYDQSIATANGSWLAQGREDGSVCWAPVRGGTLKMEENEDGTYKATFDLTDDAFIPNSISGSFTGEIPLMTASTEESAEVSALPRIIALSSKTMR